MLKLFLDRQVVGGERVFDPGALEKDKLGQNELNCGRRHQDGVL
jgi:hypothetical protein